MHTILEEQEKEFDSSYNKSNGLRLSKRAKDDLRHFLRLSNLACMNAVLKMVEEKMPKQRKPYQDKDGVHLPTISDKKYNEALSDISTTLSEIKKSLTNEQ